MSRPHFVWLRRKYLPGFHRIGPDTNDKLLLRNPELQRVHRQTMATSSGATLPEINVTTPSVYAPTELQVETVNATQVNLK